MRVYTCNNCHNPLYFENNICLYCNHTVGFDAAQLDMISLVRQDSMVLYAINDPKQQYRFCDNAKHGTCNWLIPKEAPGLFCKACELNRTIPTLYNTQSFERWKRIEIAKHRLVYSLLRLGLPVQRKDGSGIAGIAFDFMEDASPEERVMTGHENGTITLNIEEADEVELTRHKQGLGERYRTLLGHFRHETGHYYWDTLIKNSPSIKQFRELFGNEQMDYDEALRNYYATGAPANWTNYFISPYATAHPWEDWAESWSHYLHMMDTLETAFSFGVGIAPNHVPDPSMTANINSDPYSMQNFDDIIRMWLPLTFALNSLNRSMGHMDFYPFIISSAVKEKLRFIHDTCSLAKNQARPALMSGSY